MSVLNPGEILAERIRTKRKEWIQQRREKPKSHPSNRASELGHPCLRYLVLCRTAGEKAAPLPDDTLTLFREGNIHEADILKGLHEIGISLYGTQESFPPNSYNITGHIDGLHGFYCPYPPPDLTVDEAEPGEYRPIPWVEVGAEIKSVNPYHWERIKTAEDMLYMPAFFIRKWYTQSQVYLFLKDLRWWIFVLKNKMTGAWKVIAMEIDLDFVQSCLDKAEQVNEHVANNSLPPFIADPSACHRCKFYGGACQPPEDYGKGMTLLRSPHIIQLAEDAVRFDRKRREYGALYNQFREIIRLLCKGEDRMYLAGNALIEARHDSAGTLRISFRNVKPSDKEEP